MGKPDFSQDFRLDLAATVDEVSDALKRVTEGNCLKEKYKIVLSVGKKRNTQATMRCNVKLVAAGEPDHWIGVVELTPRAGDKCFFRIPPKNLWGAPENFTFDNQGNYFSRVVLLCLQEFVHCKFVDVPPKAKGPLGFLAQGRGER